MYHWTRTRLQERTDFLDFDNIRLDGTLGKAKFAYNSGQMLQAAALLYSMTLDPEYLEQAQEIAQACYRYFFTDFTPDK